MNALDVLRAQLRGSCELVAERAPSVEPVWLQRAAPGVSLPGFIIWHCARVIDWGVNNCVREEPEIAASPRWSERLRYEMGHGAGLSAADAEDVAASVTAADVVEYTRELQATIDGWLSSLSDSDLDRPVDVREANRLHARYSTPAAWEEVKNLDGVPAWQFLLRPCGNHIRIHIGELDALVQLTRPNSPIGS